jgi:protein gp37
MRADWARDIRTQCEEAGVAFFFKQWGAHNEEGVRVGKGRAGRLLDGRTWDAMPPRSQAR